jgi:hypothetical protein
VLLATLLQIIKSEQKMNHWKKKDVPHKGWKNEGYEDLEEPIHVCDMCGQKEIRHVHILSHPSLLQRFRVGRICADHMTNDYVTAERQLTEMKKRARWMATGWTPYAGCPYSYVQKSTNTIYGRRLIGIFIVEGMYHMHADWTLIDISFFKITDAKKFIYKCYME